MLDIVARLEDLAAVILTRLQVDVVRAAQLERIKSLPPLYQLEKLPWFMARSLRRKLRRIGSKSRISSSDNLAALAEPGPPGSDSLDGVKRKRGGLGSAEAQAAVADATLGDVRALDELIECLGDRDRAIGRAAHAALRGRIDCVSLAFGGDAEHKGGGN